MRPETKLAPWHKESYDRFITESLPELIAQRLPLEAYSVAEAGPHECSISISVAGRDGSVGVVIDGVPRPDEDGVFEVGGQRKVVTPTASGEELDRAEIKCVGEQLHDFVEARLGEATTELPWDESLLASWLPLGKWINEFLEPAEEPAWMATKTALVLDDQNWLARCESLRRIMIPGRERVTAPGQSGRTCPVMTPEGLNIGRTLYAARSAEISNGRLIAKGADPAAKLSFTASMIPLLEHDEPARAQMGANMMRQWMALPGPEPALVQTGNEPDAPDFWCGRNLLTAFVSWGVGTFEDGVLISESCAKRLAVDGLIEPGDKLSNRHGSKGVVSQILPDEQMPHLADGTPVELVFNFIGQHARMNFGQVREALLGRIARAEGQPLIAPPFAGPSNTDIRARLKKAGLPTGGMETLRDGKDGPALERPSTVGWVYWGVTYHLARHKLRVSDGATDCMRQGQMEYLALRDMGAFEVLNEQFNTRCADRDAEDIQLRTAKADVEQAGAPAPAFTALGRRLAAAGIRADFDGKAVTLALQEPEDEALVLARPVPHPWLRDHRIARVGKLPEVAELEAVVEADGRLRRAMKGNAPDSLLARCERSLEKAVGEYLDALVGPEQLRFGCRVAFSGRCVIAPGIDLRRDQVGLPEEMAWRLFGPMAVRALGGGKEVEKRSARAAKKLDEIMAGSWVLLNRAPTFMPTAILACRPVRVPGRALRLHPMACAPMNADFDGDQMAVFLPITAAGQKEAGEELCIAAHLKRDAELLRWLAPAHESLWGLAWTSLSEGGRNEIAAITKSDICAEGRLLTRDRLVSAVQPILERDGAEAALDVLERLWQLGFQAAKLSGASLSPFAGESLTAPAGSAPTKAHEWTACDDEVKDLILSSDDYASDDFGPQLLAVKSGARGSVAQLVRSFCCRAVGADERGGEEGWAFVPRGLIDGYRPEDFFSAAADARWCVAQTALNVAETGKSMLELYGVSEPGGAPGFRVLARAMRSVRPGAVFARAAAAGEADPLTDLDARLFVGLRP